MIAVRPRPRTLPLGIDLGSTRIRVALAHRHPDGSNELVAVATRQHVNDPIGAMNDAVSELQTRERRCVFGLGEPQAILRKVRFPTMRRAETERAARFEAKQFVDFPIDEAVVRVIPLGSDGDAAIGVVRKDVIHSLITIAHAAQLRVTAIDNNALALRRALPDVDAILDIGVSDSRLYVFSGLVPTARRMTTGGAAFTTAIAQAFGADEATAQKRKHSHGITGCAEAELDLLVAAVAAALVECRSHGLGDVRTIALVGNGSRLAELPALLERATAVRVRYGYLGSATSSVLPPDVLRAAAPDWCLAYGLALWAAA